MLSTGEGGPIARSFAILAQVKLGMPRWSMVYDLGVGEVHFKTITNAQKKLASLMVCAGCQPTARHRARRS